MDVEDLEIIAQSCAEDVQALALLKHQLPKAEFECRIIDLLGSYIDSADAIGAVVQYNTFSWELSVLLEKHEDEKFLRALGFYTRALKESFFNHTANVASQYRRLYPELRESLQSWHDCFFLQSDIHKKKPRHLARSYFRMMGDAIESSVSRHVKIIYQIIRSNEQGYLCNSPAKASFGKMLSELSNADEIGTLYLIQPYGISLSQWRNIAQHSSYVYREQSGLIDCVYGSGSKERIFVSVDELRDVVLKVFEIQKIHKIALEFFELEIAFQGRNNSQTITRKNEKDSKVTLETVMSEFFHQLALYGYTFLAVRQDGNESTIEVGDTHCKGLEFFKSSTRNASVPMRMAQEMGFDLVVELYTNQGKKLSAMRVKCKRHARCHRKTLDAHPSD